MLPSPTNGQPFHFGSSEEVGVGCRYCKCHDLSDIILMGFPQRKGSATITRIPIGSNLFSAQHAAKKPVKSKPSNTEAVASDNPTVPSTPASATPSVSLHHP